MHNKKSQMMEIRDPKILLKSISVLITEQLFSPFFFFNQKLYENELNTILIEIQLQFNFGAIFLNFLNRNNQRTC